MTRIKYIFLVFILLFNILLTSCKPVDEKPTIEEKGPHIRGEITHLTRVENGNVVIRVEGTIMEDTLFDKVDVTVKEETQLFIKDAQGYRRITKDELTIGQIVEALFVGPIAESYPAKATASEIVILTEEVDMR